MPETPQQNPNSNNQEPEIVIRTMQQDLEKGGLGALKEEVKPKPGPVKVAPLPPTPALPTRPERAVGTPTPPAAGVGAPPPPKLEVPVPPITLPPTPTPAPAAPPTPAPPAPPLPPTPPTPLRPPGLPTLKVPPRIIPPKEVPIAPIGALPKAAPVWLRLGIIAIVAFLVTFFGLYIYWKIFVQGPAPEPQVPAQEEPTIPTLPETQPPVPAQPIQFFKKLPNKAVTIDLPIKDAANLSRALESEARITEEREQVKQIILTYQGRAIELREFFELMQIFAPQNFLDNYEKDYAFFFFSQKEGARPGIILKAKDSNLAQNQMLDWEKTTLPSDVLTLFLSTLKSTATPIAFKSYSLAGQPVRYVNVPVPFSSLNYSIYNDFLVMTTSSRGMFKVMNDLTGQTVSQRYLETLQATIDSF